VPRQTRERTKGRPTRGVRATLKTERRGIGLLAASAAQFRFEAPLAPPACSGNALNSVTVRSNSSLRAPGSRTQRATAQRLAPARSIACGSGASEPSTISVPESFNATRRKSLRSGRGFRLDTRGRRDGCPAATGQPHSLSRCLT
jgi:hypothetical protein